ncbi:glucose-1-phosphate cytidylyltransferase [Desulfolutivibrio sulfoxidireducens]|uniref:glucose-1-phosphate cytidylyltransferase n=1 Tax=Desulfolutivibrio sulfoxidireducens TaxID=2773299 RepID=UPI00159E02DC|nr:glucose-1-phosphate cytidylyltransferase [Desulfolutivibrio sulfoxidireducens]QLA18211.1 glucose-1-phosphate cytidylyltransferase [Desulfolutivibrio sulfoxidireducens]
MQVVILCGGLGTRLREETEFRPKPMVAIGGRPVLWHIMKLYAAHGHTDFVLPLGYKGDMIKDYFYHYELRNNDVMVELGHPGLTCLCNRHDEAGWRVVMVDTGAKNLKGSRLKQVERYITDDTFMLTYGDGLADVDIPGLLAFHASHGKMVTVTGVNLAARFGELGTKGDRVVRFQEKPARTEGGLVNGGFFVCRKDLFGLLDEAEGCDLEYGPLERLAEEGELMVYRHTGFWACMDTLRDMDYLNALWKAGQAAWKIWT